MHTVHIDPANVSAAEGNITQGTPFLMLNLLRFKQEADYSGRPEVTPCSGREAFMKRYSPAFNDVVTTLGFKEIHRFWLGVAVANVVAPPEEHWDMVALIHYPNFAAFRAVTESEAYKANAEHHRMAALEDCRLIATTEFNIPPS